MKYKISLWNHLRVLDLLIFLSIGLYAFVFYERHYNAFAHPGIEFDIFILWIVNLIPVLYLHIEYWYYNRGTELEIDAYEKKFIYTDKTGTTETYSFDDLSKIIVYMPPHFHSKTMFIRIPFDTYHYAKIYTKSGKEIIITCLMVRKVQDLVGSIRGVPVEKKRRIFASILIG
jgi:hypothetical protein